jgi:hypothetical protein
VGLCASVFWDAGHLLDEGDWGYFWSLELGDWDGGVQLGYMSFGFRVSGTGEWLVLTPGLIDVAAEKWAKRYSQNSPGRPIAPVDPAITKESVKENAFASNTGVNLGSPKYTLYKDAEITFGYATESYVNDDEWIYGWVTFVFENGVPYAKEGCYVFGADGIYAGTGIIIPRQIPEPGTLSLVLVGIAGLMLKRRCRP